MRHTYNEDRPGCEVLEKFRPTPRAQGNFQNKSTKSNQKFSYFNSAGDYHANRFIALNCKANSRFMIGTIIA